MIPSNITREHILKAMDEIDSVGVPEDRQSTKFYLTYGGKNYPPKYTISLANKYANGGELHPSTFSGGDETNPFLKQRGFDVILIPENDKLFDDRLLSYLARQYPDAKIERVKRSWLRVVSSGALIYVNGSKEHTKNEGWYDLEQEIYNELVSNSNSYYALILGYPEKTFVLPREQITAIFENQELVGASEDAKKKPRWMFTILEKEGTHFLRLNRSGSVEHNIESYLQAWSRPFRVATNSLNLEDLILSFDKNRKLFNPKRLSDEEREKIRLDFASRFPPDKIPQMQIDEYVIGKPGSSGEPRRDTFCYGLEFGVKEFGAIGGKASNKYGIYYDKEEQKYIYNAKKFDSPQTAFETVRSELVTILQATSEFEKDGDLKKLSEILEGDFNIHRPVVSKIVCIYYPTLFVDIHTADHIARILSAFGAESVAKDNKLFIKQGKLLEIKNSHPVMRSWSNSDFSHFVWQTIIGMPRAAEREKEQQAGGVHNNSQIFVTAYDQQNLSISKKGSILGWKNNSKNLASGDYVFVYNITTKRIDSCFKIKTKSARSQPIWQDEIARNQQHIIYPYRWDADLIIDNLNIDLETINQIEPFADGRMRFALLIKGNYPRSIESAEYLPFRSILLSKLPNASEAIVYLILRSEPDSKWQDEEGKRYKFGSTVPNHLRLVPGAHVIFDRNIDGKIVFTGCAVVDSVHEQETDQTTKSGQPISEKIAELKEYQKFAVPRERTEEVTAMLEALKDEGKPYNNQNSIRQINKKIYDMIISGSSQNLRSWSSLTKEDIDEIVRSALNVNGKRLEIDESIVRRILYHLISSKHVILAGPPGTGKSDLAMRLLEQLSLKILGKEETVKTVASYEWGRYEVIGANTIDAPAGTDKFHLGCVSKAIKENKFLLIDEFNRADMNKAFGEMFLAMDHGKLMLRDDEKPLWLQGESGGNSNIINIPSHFRMICTLNDYDKSLLNELSYGLLRRFAFVEIDIPNDDAFKQKEKNVVIERVREQLRSSDQDIEKVMAEVNEHIDKFADLMHEIRKKRSLGISTSLDVVRYLASGMILQDGPNSWKLLDEALVDYILPQLDRLDLETMRHIQNSASAIFSTEASSVGVQEFQKKLSLMISKLQDRDKLFNVGAAGGR
jgi:MoxR-like ATPase